MFLFLIAVPKPNYLFAKLQFKNVWVIKYNNNYNNTHGREILLTMVHGVGI